MTQLRAPLVGMRFRPAGLLVFSNLPAGCRLTLEPEPDNAYDQYAVKVLVSLTELPEQSLPLIHDALPGHGQDPQDYFYHPGESGIPELRDDLPLFFLGYIAKTHSEAVHKGLTGAGTPLLDSTATLGFALDGKPDVLLLEENAVIEEEDTGEDVDWPEEKGDQA